MRTAAFILSAALLLAGCGVEVVTVAATQAELQKQAAQSATRQLQRAGESTGRTQAERAIQTWHAEKGFYPPSLEALVPDYLASVPVRGNGQPFGYDPATGRLLDNAVAGPDPRDLQTIAEINRAINQYGTATGFYPPTLDVLAPYYLPQAPRTVDGREFVYNNQNGFVGLPPSQTGQSALPGAGTRGPGGAGPLGEVMTGIGIQQELGNRPQAGTSAAGSHGRRAVGGAAAGQNRRAEEALGWVE